MYQKTHRPFSRTAPASRRASAFAPRPFAEEVREQDARISPDDLSPVRLERAARFGHRFPSPSAPPGGVIQRTEEEALRVAQSHYKGTGSIGNWHDVTRERSSFSDKEWEEITRAYNRSFQTREDAETRKKVAREASELYENTGGNDPMLALGALHAAASQYPDLKPVTRRDSGLRLRNRTKEMLEEETRSPNWHPMSHVETDDGGAILTELHKLDPRGTLKDLALERTEASRNVMKNYRESRDHGAQDELLLKSILSMRELHKSGAVYSMATGTERPEDEETRLLQRNVGAARERALEIAEAYGLDEHERRSLTAYTNANKTVKYFDDKQEHPNPNYMGSWTPKELAKHQDLDQPIGWGTGHGTGWKALEGAMGKLPNLGQLGLRMTTYRASREGTEASELDKLQSANIYHGHRVMDMGQRHYMSTAMTYNVHFTEDRIRKAGGIQAITGTSGVFIDPWGQYPAVDGGEVLYPPGVTTRDEGRDKNRYRGKEESYPIHNLRELSRPEHPDRRLTVEDEKFRRLGTKLKQD